jgi:hypothetical protein
MRADISLALGQLVKGRIHDTALAARVPKAEPNRHDVLKARVVIRKALEKLANRERLDVALWRRGFDVAVIGHGDFL